MSATIRDVAERAGVSIKTVSRVINDEPFVRETTRQKVLAAVNELGFAVNLSARRLATGQSFAIGLIFLPFIFYPMLGFGSAQYNPVGGEGGAPVAPAPPAQ